MARPLKSRALPSRAELLSDVSHKVRMEIIARYARLLPSGIPMRCTARTGADDGHLKEKYIYDSIELAEECAQELRKTGMTRQWAYLCSRSAHGHAHLTSKRGHDVQAIQGLDVADRHGGDS